jgi:hypothetical protein
LAKTLSYELRKRAETHVKKVEEDFLNLNQRLRKKWRDFYRIYRLFENEGKLPGQSDVFIPKIWEIIEKKTPAVVAHSPKFVLTPRKNDAIEYLPQVRDALNFWWEEDKVQERLEGWVKEGFVYGTAVGKVGWNQEWKTLEMEYEDIDEETGETVKKTEEEDVLVIERPTFETRSIFDVLTDPRCDTLEESIANIDILDNQRLSQLLQDGDIYDLSRLKKDKDILSARQDSKYTPEEKRELDEFMGVSGWRGDIDKGTFTLKEYWGYFSPDGKPEKEEEYIITTVWQDKTLIDVIRCERNDKGFRPFIEFIDHKVQGEFYGIGEVEPLEGLQIEYNNLRNARIDFNNSVNYPEWMYNLNAGINPSTLVHRPNNMIGVELPIGTDINTVLRTVEKPIAPQSGYAEEAQLNRDFQTISQTIDYTDRGGVQGFNSTATGVESRDAERSKQINNVVRHLETSISRIGELWLRLADYFVEDEILIRRKRTPRDIEREKQSGAPEGVPSLDDVPDKFTKVSAEVFKDIAERATVKVEAGSTTAYSAVGKAKDAVNIGNTTAQFMQLGVPVDATKVFTDILRDAYQKPNPESYIKDMQQQQPQGGQPPGQGGGMLPQNAESRPNPPKGGSAPMQPSPVNTVADG